MSEGERAKRANLQRRVTVLVLLATVIFIMFAAIQGGLQASYRLQQTASVYYGMYTLVFLLILVLANLLLFSLRGATSGTTKNTAEHPHSGNRPISAPEDDTGGASFQLGGNPLADTTVRSVGEGDEAEKTQSVVVRESQAETERMSTV